MCTNNNMNEDQVVPYNIYKEKVDHNGNGVVCRLNDGKLSVEQIILLLCVIFAILSGNIILWIIFMKKLFKMANQLKGDTNNLYSSHLIISYIKLMKEQTMIIGIIIISNILAYGVKAIIPSFQSLFIDIINWIINIFAIFISFKFNRYWFELFKCDLLTNICCHCIDKKVQSRGTLTRINSNSVIAEIQMN